MGCLGPGWGQASVVLGPAQLKGLLEARPLLVTLGSLLGPGEGVGSHICTRETWG